MELPKPTLDLSLVLPVLDPMPDLELIFPSLQQALTEFGPRFEIIVVDSSGSDLHRAVAARFGAVYCTSEAPGYGAATIRGVSESQGEYVLTMDPDAAYPDRAVRALWEAREGADVVVASRYVAGSQPEQPALRHFLSRAINGFLNRVLSTPVKDLTSGFRLYRRRVFVRFDFTMTNLAFLLESLLKCFGNGFFVREVPFRYKLNQYRLAQAHGLRLALECLQRLFTLWRIRNSIDCADYDLRAYDSRIPLQRYWQRTRHHIVMRFAAGAGPALNVGCGSGRIMADQPDGVGIDIRFDRLYYMRQTNRLLAQADGLRLPFRDASFQCIICSEVIEHVPDEDGRLIDELTRVLTPGGTLVLGTPDYGTVAWPFFEWLYGKVAPNAYAHEHVTRYTCAQLRDALISRGYDVLNQGYVCRSIVTLKARKGEGDSAEL
jgi:glycosyltransferase involved in cell wall biosynthesis